MTPSLRVVLPILVGLAVAPLARSAAPPARESEDVRRFYALPPKAIARLGEQQFRHGRYPTAAFSHDGRTYYTAGGLNEVRAWDLRSGRLVRRFALPSIRGAISRLHALPDGKRLFAQRTASFYGQLALSRDEKYAVYYGRWYDLATGKERLFGDGHVGGVTAVALHERTAATASDDGTVRGWDAKTGKQLWQTTLTDDLATPISLSFSPKGDEVAVLSQDDYVHVLNAKTGKQRLRTEKVTAQATVVRWSPDGRWLAAGGGSYTLHLFDEDSGKLRKKFVGYDGSMNTDWSFAFSPDGKTIVAPAQYNGRDFGGQGGEEKFPRRKRKPIGPDDYDPRLGPPNDPDDHKTYLALWDVASGKRLRVLGEAGRDVVFSKEGKRIALWVERQIHVRDVASGKDVYKFKADWGPIASLHGHTLIIGGKEYDTVHKAAMREWAEQQRYVAVSPNGKRMITAGWYDSTPLLWDLEE